MVRIILEKLRQLAIYPFKLQRIFSPRPLTYFLFSYLTGRSLIKIKVRQLPTPLFMRPRSSDIRVAYEIFATDELRFHWPFRRSPMTIIDGGANVGYVTLALNQRWPNASILAIEPDFLNFSILQKNTDSLPTVSSLQKGIWGQTCNLTVRPETTSSAWGLQFTPITVPKPGSIPAITIPELIESLPNNHCDLLKLDIEGAELNVFSQTDLSWMERVSVLLIETHGIAARDLLLSVSSLLKLNVTTSGEKLILSKSDSTQI